FFGGPFGVDYETRPPEWLCRFLPLSARGWTPTEKEIDPKRTWFLGFNWAVRARDLRRAGGFDIDIGPGSASNSTGDEVALQKSLHELGLRSRLVPDAMVWHHVPACRCTPEWALDRAYRDGLARGHYVQRKGGIRRMAGDVTFAIKATRSRLKLATGWDKDSPEREFRSAHDKQKAAGYHAARAA
ncbi:MAG: hypothetical protein AAF989_13740, partial [Planctomycetota bacterium]